MENQYGAAISFEIKEIVWKPWHRRRPWWPLVSGKEAKTKKMHGNQRNCVETVASATPTVAAGIRKRSQQQENT